MTDLDQLDIMRRAITALGLGQCAPEELVAAARQSSAARQQARDRIADLESALKALGINPNDDPVYHAQRWVAGRDEDRRQRDEMERSLGDATARLKAAQDRIAELEGAPPAHVAHVADTAARDMRIAELERDLACKDDAVKNAIGALTRICEVIGAPVPVCPADAVEAVTTLHAAADFAERRAKEAEQALKDINLALLDVGAPRAYTLDDKSERPIPGADRVRILGDRLRAEWREKERVNAEHSARGKEIADAHLALNDRGAPRLADGVTLTTAARIRSLPR